MGFETELNRRGFGAAMLLGALAGGLQHVASAQDSGDAAVSAQTGYVTVRAWKLVEGTDYAAFTKLVQEGYVPIIQSVEGFVQYFFANPGDNQHLAIAVFTTKEGAEASTAAAKDWTAATLGGIVDGGPLAVVEAEIWLTATQLAVSSRV